MGFSSFLSLIQTIIVLIIVIALANISLKFVGKYMAKQQNIIKIVEKVGINNNSALSVVEICGIYYLMSFTNNENKILKELDKEHAEEFESNLNTYLAELDELEKYIMDRVSELPKENRILITAHDAFNYFGKAYDFEVRGLQGISTASEAGTSDVRDLANYIVSKKIKAVFVESSVPRKSIEALQEAVKAQGFDVQIGGELYSDSTGGQGSGAETYITTFKANIDTIIDGLK